MNEIIAYQCSECKKVYKTKFEAQHCENKCLDRCTYSEKIEGFGGEFVELTFNYDQWEQVEKNNDRYLINVVSQDSIAFDEDGLDRLIKGIKNIKNAWLFHKTSKFKKNT